MSKSLASGKSRIKGRALTSARKEDYSRPKSLKFKPLHQSSTLKSGKVEESKAVLVSKGRDAHLSSVNDRSGQEPLTLSTVKKSPKAEIEKQEVEESIVEKDVEHSEHSVNPSHTSTEYEEQIDYNEEFESYESDFEEDNGSDQTIDETTGEELETSVYSSMSDVDVTISHQHEYEKPIQNEIKSKPIMSSEVQNDVTIRPKTSKAIVNFAKAKETQIKRQASEKLKTRGQILRDMIQLDVISIDLYTQIPESYEAFITAFGSTNKSLASVQTNEDNLSDSVQTDECLMLSKWTQKPIHISMDGNEMPSAHDYLGVGGEDCKVQPYSSVQTSSDFIKFLSTSANVVLKLLEESLASSYESPNKSDSTSNDFGRRIKLGGGVKGLLANRAAALATFCPSDPSILVTGHFPVVEHKSAETNLSHEAEISYAELGNASLLCMWSVHQPSIPQAILYARSLPLVATFSPGKPVAVIAGMSDGSLSCWDLREESKHHKVFSGINCRIQPPSYTTSCDEDINSGGSPIIAIHTLEIDRQSVSEHNGSFQVVTLSSSGEITWWVLIQELKQGRAGGVFPHLGAAPWSCIALLKSAQQHVTDLISQEIAIEGSELCCDLHLSGREKSHFFVAMTTGVVLHISRYHVKLRPHFVPEIQPGTKATTLSVSPHDPNFLLVGSSDGTIRLHSLASALPVTQWQASTDPSPVRKLIWSQSRPCVFYMLDDAGCIHMWDLCAGDIHPITTLQSKDLVAEGSINCMGISGSLPGLETNSYYAAFGSDCGSLVLCPLSSHYVSSCKEDYGSELDKFRCYVSII